MARIKLTTLSLTHLVITIGISLALIISVPVDGQNATHTTTSNQKVIKPAVQSKPAAKPAPAKSVPKGEIELSKSKMSSPTSPARTAPKGEVEITTKSNGPRPATTTKTLPIESPQFNAGIEKAKKNDFDGAIKDFDFCIQKNKKDFNAYFFKAKCLIELKKTDEAISNLTTAIGINPFNPMFFYYRGMLYNSQGKTTESLQDFDKAINLKPDFTEVLNYRGMTYERLGKHAEALEDFEKIIKLKPDYDIAYYNKGTAQAGLEKYEEAIISFTKSIQLDPKKPLSYMNRGNCFNMINDFEAAIKDYTEAIALDPANGNAYFNRGMAYHNTDDKAACEDWFKAKSLGINKVDEMIDLYCK